MAVITAYIMNILLNGIKKTDVYSLYSTPFVINNQASIVKSVDKAFIRFNKIFNNANSTGVYNRYNIFSIGAGDLYFYTIYQLIVAAARDRVGDDRPLWMQCWLNYHKEDEVLDWHDHANEILLHGYLSIEPRNTVTEFREFAIENKVGNLYVGLSGLEHRVRVCEPYEGIRITIAFDIIESQSQKNSAEYNLSFIPI